MTRWIVISAATLAIVAITVDYSMFGNEPPCLSPSEKMSEFDKVAFAQFSEMNKYLISLATLLLGGLGAIAMKFNTLCVGSERSETRTALASAGAFGVTSLYFAFLSHVRLAEAAINECTSFGAKLQCAQFLQFSTLILGVLIACYIALRYTSYVRTDD